MAKKPAQKTYKLDIFDTLSQIDRKNYDYLSGLPEEIKKGFAPVVVLRWTGAVEGQFADTAMILTNEIANINFYDLYDHPELQYRLLAASGLGMKQRHSWIPFPKTRASSSKIYAYVEQFFPMASPKEIDLIISQFTKETFIDFLTSTGCTQEYKELIDAFEKKEAR